MAVRVKLREVYCNSGDDKRLGYATAVCLERFRCAEHREDEERPSIEARCSSCGGFMGYVVASCTHRRFCSISCTEQRKLRENEHRDSLVCEQAAHGMTAGELAEIHGLTPQNIYSILKGF